NQRIGTIVITCLYRLIDGNGQGLSTPWYAACTQQCGPKLAQGTSKGQLHTRQNATHSQRQSDPQKNTPGAYTQHPCTIFQRMVDILECSTSRFQHHGKSHHGGGNHSALPGENQLNAQTRQPAAQPTSTPQQHKQVIAHH